jgi:hypothetical protein
MVHTSYELRSILYQYMFQSRFTSKLQEISGKPFQSERFLHQQRQKGYFNIKLEETWKL